LRLIDRASFDAQPIIEVVDLVWKGLRPPRWGCPGRGTRALKSLTWFGRDCDKGSPHPSHMGVGSIEVVDLVWKGLRLINRDRKICYENCIEVVDLVWKGLRQGRLLLRGAVPDH